MKYLKLEYVIAVVGAFILSSCSPENDKGLKNIIYPKVIHQMDRFDEHFFNRIRDIEFYDGKFYFITSSSQNVIYCLRNDYQVEYAFGKEGHGPSEFIDATKFCINEDTVFIADAGKIKMLSYRVDGKFIQERNLTDQYYSQNNFAVDALGNFFAASPLNEFPLAMVNRASNEMVKSFGSRITHSYEDDDFINNRFHIHKSDSFLISISTTNPIINVYDLFGIQRDEVEIPANLVKSRISFKQKEISKNPEKKRFEYILNYDTYIYNDELYILICENIEESGFTCNKIAVFGSINSVLKLKTIIQLPGKVYEAFCLNSEKIVAYESITNTVQFLDIPN